MENERENKSGKRGGTFSTSVERYPGHRDSGLRGGSRHGSGGHGTGGRPGVCREWRTYQKDWYFACRNGSTRFNKPSMSSHRIDHWNRQLSCSLNHILSLTSRDIVRNLRRELMTLHSQHLQLLAVAHHYPDKTGPIPELVPLHNHCELLSIPNYKTTHLPTIRSFRPSLVNTLHITL